MAIPELWGIDRRIDRLAGVEDRHEKAISSLRADLDALTARVIRLEAKAAAGTAAGVAASGYMSDIARRMGILEALAGQSGLPRLAPS